MGKRDPALAQSLRAAVCALGTCHRVAVAALADAKPSLDALESLAVNHSESGAENQRRRYFNGLRLALRIYHLLRHKWVIIDEAVCITVGTQTEPKP